MCFIGGREQRYDILYYKALPSLEQALLTTFHSCKAGTYSHINRRFPVLLFTMLVVIFMFSAACETGFRVALLF